MRVDGYLYFVDSSGSGSTPEGGSASQGKRKPVDSGEGAAPFRRQPLSQPFTQRLPLPRQLLLGMGWKLGRTHT